MSVCVCACVCVFVCRHAQTHPPWQLCMPVTTFRWCTPHRSTTTSIINASTSTMASLDYVIKSLSLFRSVALSVCLSVCLSVSPSLSVSVCICICICLCLCICICLCLWNVCMCVRVCMVGVHARLRVRVQLYGADKLFQDSDTHTHARARAHTHTPHARAALWHGQALSRQRSLPSPPFSTAPHLLSPPFLETTNPYPLPNDRGFSGYSRSEEALKAVEVQNLNATARSLRPAPLPITPPLPLVSLSFSPSLHHFLRVAPASRLAVVPVPFAAE